MRSSSSTVRRTILVVALLIAAAILAARLWPRGRDLSSLLRTDPALYRKMVSAFTIAATMLQVGDTKDIGSVAPVPTRLVPEEPAGWANLGLAYIRLSSSEHNTLPEAAKALEEAHRLAPHNSQIERYLGLLANRQGRPAEAIQHFRKAIEDDPKDVRARYALIQLLFGSPNADAEALNQWRAIATIQPDNLRAQLELATAAARAGDTKALRDTLAGLRVRAGLWSVSSQADLSQAEKAVAGPEPSQALTSVMVLKNVLMRMPAYPAGSAMLESTENNAGDQPFDRFLLLPNPSPLPAPPDPGLTFAAEPPAKTDPEKWSIARTVTLVPELKSQQANEHRKPVAEEGPQYLLQANGREVRLTAPGKSLSIPFPGGPAAIPPSPEGVLPTDWSYHFRLDLVLAGAGGLRLLLQQPDSTFKDVTTETTLPTAIVSAPYLGAWPADVDSDGDLDIVLGTRTGLPIVLRNNGDRTFQVIHPFPNISGLTAFAWADLNGDGNPDVALIDGAGHLHLFENLRGGEFREWPSAMSDRILALSAIDVDRDDIPDLIALRADGAILRISRRAEGTGWETEEIARWPNPPADGSARLLWADLDNNGSPDLLATGSSGTQVWLSDPQGKLAPLRTVVDATRVTVAEPSVTFNGRLDLVGISAAGQPVRLVNRGTKSYNWRVIRPRSQYFRLGEEGDKRINSFGLGGTAQIRAGFLVEDMPIAGAQVHFGLGDNVVVDYERTYWSNGRFNGEFEPSVNGFMAAPQRINTSCPWLFSWNGHEMTFVTDILWSSPLGLRINAQDTAGVASTRDWVKVRADQLAPRDGFYDLRITAELWETHFFDIVRLMTVDHPAGTDIFVDERFSVPPPPLAVRLMTPPRPVLAARDDRGQDMTDVVRARDGRYLDTFGRGAYQGVTRDHYVEVTLGDDDHPFTGGKATAAGTSPPLAGGAHTGPLYLVAYGWVHPTDSSINVALSQGHHDAPRDLRLEVPDGRGGWRVARPHRGFPAGKNKTIVEDLTGLFPPGIPHKLRLRTNLEVYWDFIGYAYGLPDTGLRMRQIAPAVADLRYHGFSATSQQDDSSPELPNYNRIAAVGPQWRDLEGYYTRYGDVRELLAQVDDRYVILNAGDEIALRFPVPPPPPPGWTRDFVFISDGWEKDGNFNTGFSKTVLPLPSHDNPAYNRPPGRLEDDPVYRRHPRDWQVYHTRYVTPYAVQHLLHPSR